MTSTPRKANPTSGGGAAIHPLRSARNAVGPGTEPEPRVYLEEAAEIVAQAMSTLLRGQLSDRARATCATRGLASTNELCRMIDTFLSIRDVERRRYCLAVLRSSAMADAEERGNTG